MQTWDSTRHPRYECSGIQVKAGKVSTEVAMLVNALMMLVNIILSIFMEKSTKKTSANSSIPPSQTPPDDTSITNKSKTGEENGKQKTVTVAGNTRTAADRGSRITVRLCCLQRQKARPRLSIHARSKLCFHFPINWSRA